MTQAATAISTINKLDAIRITNYVRPVHSAYFYGYDVNQSAN